MGHKEKYSNVAASMDNHPLARRLVPHSFHRQYPQLELTHLEGRGKWAFKKIRVPRAKIWENLQRTPLFSLR